MSNAIKFSPRGEEVTLRAHGGGGRVVFEVIDRGVGLAPGDAARIFEPFERVAPRGRPGLGLGLYLARHVAEAHGGEVVAESPGPGRGATLTLRLPASFGAAPTPGEDAAPKGRYRFLLVEDEEDVALLLETTLRRRGHETAWAGDVVGALQALDGDAFDVLVSDIGLPGGSGLDVARAARLTPRPPWAVALTGYSDAQTRASAEAAGFDALLVKPVQVEDLLADVARLEREKPRQSGG